MQLAGVIEALSGATSPEAVFELVCGAAAPLGYRWVGLFAPLSASMTPLPPGRRQRS